MFVICQLCHHWWHQLIWQLPVPSMTYKIWIKKTLAFQWSNSIPHRYGITSLKSKEFSWLTSPFDELHFLHTKPSNCILHHVLQINAVYNTMTSHEYYIIMLMYIFSIHIILILWPQQHNNPNCPWLKFWHSTTTMFGWVDQQAMWLIKTHIQTHG